MSKINLAFLLGTVSSIVAYRTNTIAGLLLCGVTSGLLLAWISWGER